jgi:DNA-entry nuclease
MMMTALTMAACGRNASDQNFLSETAYTMPQQEAENQAPQAGVERHETDLLGAGNASAFSLTDIPSYSGEPYAVVNGNVPYFSASDLTTTSFEDYSELDSLGRCGAAYASIGTDLMPTEERGAIGQVKPSGWHTVKYDCIDGMYLYNRCHLIGYQLTGENANVKNLITGTRYLNVTGMLPFENMVTDYIKETGNHVMYRVTPVFEGTNLVASGVLMEGESVEDGGDGIEYCVFVYNIQPGITIDYATGDSQLTGSETESKTEIKTESETEVQTTQSAQSTEGTTYILNTNTKKFHYPSCSSVDQMKEKNKKSFTGSRDEVIAQGYASCGRCHP